MNQVEDIIQIDGSEGEGGGQIFRTSLTLSMCLGVPVRITNIRAKRKKSGLLRQHLACLRAARQICNAEVKGEEIGSSEVEFIPGTVKAGDYKFVVGSAGSTVLIFQTVYLPLLFASDVSTIQFEGGTHNGLAPSFDFLQMSLLPQLKKMGANIDVEMIKYGFNPMGGGKWRATISPSREWQPLKLLSAGELQRRQAVALSTKIPHHISERELDVVRRKLLWAGNELQQQFVDSDGPGNMLSLRMEYEQVSEVIEIVGEVGIRAENVSRKAIKKLNEFIQADVPVGEYLADQLMLPLVLGAGGEYLTSIPSLHTETNASVIHKFLPNALKVKNFDQARWTVKSSGNQA